MTPHTMIYGILGLASVGLVALNLGRASQGAPAQSGEETEPLSPPTLEAPAKPPGPLPPDSDPAPPPPSPAEQLRALTEKILRNRVSDPYAAPATPAQTADPSAATMLERHGMPVVPFPAPKVWREFEVEGLTFQINPLVIESADAD